MHAVLRRTKKDSQRLGGGGGVAVDGQDGVTNTFQGLLPMTFRQSLNSETVPTSSWHEGSI